MTAERKAPRWADPFLLALMRTGKVREAAKWAGVDFTTAYARRKRHRDFAGQWDDALALFRARRAEAEDAEVRRIEAEGEPASRDTLGTNGPVGMAPPGSAAPSPASAAGGTGLQLRRAHSARWTEAKERRFFDELVASANVTRAAAAAGVSTNAVYARRAKSAPFRARWAQALANGRAAIEMSLVAEAKRAMDPGDMDLPAPEPRVSVSEAIKITQLGAARGAGRGSGASAGWAGSEWEDEESDEYQRRVEALRDKLRLRLKRLRERRIREEGYTVDPVTGECVPPGYVRVSDLPQAGG